MKRPTKVNIGGLNYPLVYLDASEITPDVKDAITFGAFYDNQQIQIAKNFDESVIKNTILHECVHAMDAFSNIELDEEQVGLLGNQLLLFIKMNKGLIKYIIDDKAPEEDVDFLEEAGITIELEEKKVGKRGKSRKG